MHTQAREPNRLRALRKQRGLKLYDLAALARRETSTIHRWETGKSAIPDDAKRLFASHFQVSIEHLMGWDRDDEPAEPEVQAA